MEESGPEDDSGVMALVEVLGGSAFARLALVGGEGVIGGSSPSSSGLMGGLLFTPVMNSSADSVRSSSRSSGLLNDLPLRDAAPFGGDLRDILLLFGSGVPMPLVQPLPNDIDPGGVLFLNLELAIGRGGDLVHVGAFSTLVGSVFITTLEKVSEWFWWPLEQCPSCGICAFVSLLWEGLLPSGMSLCGACSFSGVSGKLGDCLMFVVSYR